MTSILGRTLAGALIALAAAGTAPVAFAQESTNQVAVMTDWSVFTEENPKECWGVSSPKESVITKDGQPTEASRSEILLFVTFTAEGGSKGQVSFTGGYPFKPGSTVQVAIDGNTFDLFTENEFAWTANDEADAAILAALKKGSTAVVVGFSAKDKKTQDTFSLRGFTAAMEDAAKRCG